MYPILKRLPRDAQQPYAFDDISKDFAESENLFYMDFWPFSAPLLLVCTPSLAIQSCQTHDLIKPPVLDGFFRPFAGGDNLFTMNGPEWKRSRALFTPGFQASYIMNQLPHILEETLVYVDILKEHAQKGDIFSLDDVTIWFTMDIIGAVTLNSHINSQRGYNPLASAMRSQVRWHCADNELNPFVRGNPVRLIVQWWNGRQMDQFIGTELDKRFAEKRHLAKDKASRSMIDLALEGYLADNPSLDNLKGLDPKFRRWAITQIRLLFFAGHDSTSSTICYIYYLLYTHPEALARIRAEHDEVFSTDTAATALILRERPHLINQLPYTLAVMKEALRLFPPASAMRGGHSGADLQDAKDNRYPTEGTNIWILHSVIQRHPQYWKDPDSFIPERWLVGPEDPLYPVKGAWRPFEYGPRNCIGQTLVALDVRVVLVMTVRQFNIHNAYAEWDALHLSKEIKNFRGERAYQVSSGAAHPADGLPCRVSLRNI
ncbi:MAG: hypothetical protein MMC33_010581 [Icmadophila ericetorum]|nr:hypothetical protein [Icmadophila ericetorum]